MLFLLWDLAQMFAGECLRGNNSRRRCRTCFALRHRFNSTKLTPSESNCFDKSKLRTRSENRALVSESCGVSLSGAFISKRTNLLLDFSCTSDNFYDKDFFVEFRCVSSEITKSWSHDKHGVCDVCNSSYCNYNPDHSQKLVIYGAFGSRG